MAGIGREHIFDQARFGNEMLYSPRYSV